MILQRRLSSVYCGENHKQWRRFDFGIELDGGACVRVPLVADGSGVAAFRHFSYHGSKSGSR